MRIIHWKNEVTASSKRALDLKEIRMANGGLHLEIEEESGKLWWFDFKQVQAWKVTAEECSGSLMSKLPIVGALFLTRDSDWLKELGDAEPLKKSQHFVICCYDEVVEVLAWDCSVTSKTT